MTKEQEIYNYRELCSNCKEYNSLNIPKGIKVEDYLSKNPKENTCYICGCELVEMGGE